MEIHAKNPVINSSWSRNEVCDNPIQALVAASCIKVFLSTWSWSSHSGTDHSTRQASNLKLKIKIRPAPVLLLEIRHESFTYSTNIHRTLCSSSTNWKTGSLTPNASRPVVEAVQNCEEYNIQSQDKVPPMMLWPGHYFRIHCKLQRPVTIATWLPSVTSNLWKYGSSELHWVTP